MPRTHILLSTGPGIYHIILIFSAVAVEYAAPATWEFLCSACIRRERLVLALMWQDMPCTAHNGILLGAHLWHDVWCFIHVDSSYIVITLLLFAGNPSVGDHFWYFGLPCCLWPWHQSVEYHTLSLMTALAQLVIWKRRWYNLLPPRGKLGSLLDKQSQEFPMLFSLKW